MARWGCLGWTDSPSSSRYSGEHAESDAWFPYASKKAEIPQLVHDRNAVIRALHTSMFMPDSHLIYNVVADRAMTPAEYAASPLAHDVSCKTDEKRIRYQIELDMNINPKTGRMMLTNDPAVDERVLDPRWSIKRQRVGRHYSIGVELCACRLTGSLGVDNYELDKKAYPRVRLMTILPEKNEFFQVHDVRKIYATDAAAERTKDYAYVNCEGPGVIEWSRFHFCVSDRWEVLWKFLEHKMVVRMLHSEVLEAIETYRESLPESKKDEWE